MVRESPQVERFLHVSALGAAPDAPSKRLRTKVGTALQQRLPLMWLEAQSSRGHGAGAPRAQLASPTPNSPSHYWRCLLQYDGETAVRSELGDATIFRPAVMVGTEDRLFNAYAQLVKKLPFIPLVDGGHTRLQPAWVRDVADGEAGWGEKGWGRG